jgi:hypothetical protein
MGVGGPCECGACVQVVQASRRLPLLEEEKEEKNHVFLASLNPGTTMPASGLSHSTQLVPRPSRPAARHSVCKGAAQRGKWGKEGERRTGHLPLATPAHIILA